KAVLMPADIDGGSTVGTATPILSVSQDSFFCSDLGVQLVKLYVSSSNGSMDSCEAMVTVRDTLAPTASLQDVSVYLDSMGQGSLMAAAVDAGSEDNCSLDSLILEQARFDCADLGALQVPVRLKDPSGNETLDSVMVTVADTIAPVVTCQPLLLTLDSLGRAVIAADQLDGGSTDACGPLSFFVGQDTFTTSDIGTQLVTLTVLDQAGNQDSCQAEVTVQRNTSIKDELAATSLEFFPNPSSGMVQVEWTSHARGAVSVTLLNKLGQVVAQRELPKTTSTLQARFDLEGLADGVYLIQVRQGPQVQYGRIWKQ
ncbi:MAG: T9SS type A sorting domain-containing protein, partial [Bacteroidota bacterium]